MHVDGLTCTNSQLVKYNSCKSQCALFQQHSIIMTCQQNNRALKTLSMMSHAIHPQPHGTWTSPQLDRTQQTADIMKKCSQNIQDQKQNKKKRNDQTKWPKETKPPGCVLIQAKDKIKFKKEMINNVGHSKVTIHVE